MAGLAPYLDDKGNPVPTAPGIPGFSGFNQMIAQSALVPPDQAQVQAGQIPPMLQADPSMPAPPPGQIDNSVLKQNPVPGKGLNGYMSPPHRDTEDELLAGFQRASKESTAQQNAGIDQLQEQLGQFAQAPTSVNWTPLAAYVDSIMPGSKLTAAAESIKGLSPEQKQQYLLAQQQGLQKDKAAVSGTNLKALGEQLSMMHQRNQENLAQQRLAIEGRKADSFGGRVQVMQDTQAQKAADLFDKDPIIKTSKERLNQIQLDRHTLENAETITPQILDEITGGIATALNGGKAAGLGQQEMQQLRSLQKSIAEKSMYIQGKPYNALSPENRQMLTDVLNRIESGYGNSLATRSKELREGRSFTYNPGANQTMDNKAGAYSKFGSVYAPPGQAQQGPQIGEVHDGYKFKGGDPSDKANWEQQ